uniref:GAR domain-containing protein n=1 Tax=Trichobilharzia regenti TaxID=157069 RepID=A0AA85JLQ5_TRIRE|nr:unnamed protein product [Trichobilharzia regenti]
MEASYQISQKYDYGHNLNTNDDNNNNNIANMLNKPILQVSLNITEESLPRQTEECSTTSRDLPYKSQLNLCFKLYTEQQQTYQSMFIELQRIMKKILLHNANTEFKNGLRTIPDDRLDEIPVYCHKDYRSQLIAQYKEITHLWHKVDKRLQCLCVKLGQSLEAFNTPDDRNLAEKVYQELEERIDLSRCTVLSDFDFDEWRRNYLQWIESCHYRLADIFPTVTASTDTIQADQQKSKLHLHLSPTSSTSLTPKSVSTVSSSTQSMNNSPRHSSPPTPTTKSIKSVGKQSSSESLNLGSNDVVVDVATGSNKTHAIAKGKQTVNISKSPELNYSQFREVLLLRRRQHQQQKQHSRPKYDWANPLRIRAVFDTIDKTKKGRITHEQIIEALTDKKQQQQQQRQEQPTRQQHLRNDELIARAIEQETSKCICQIKFQPKKVGTDKYCFGPSSKVYLVRFLNSITMVRVGGGWMKLSEFLDTRDPCRIVHKRNRVGSSAPKANPSLTTFTPSGSKRENTLGFIEVTPIRGTNSHDESPANFGEEFHITSTPLLNKEVGHGQRQIPSLLGQALIDTTTTSSAFESSSNEQASTTITTKDRKKKTRKH